VLRSQLLVLLQRRHFCDAAGRPLGRDTTEQTELEIESEMRTFFRRYFTHNRYVSATSAPLDALQLQQPGVDLSTVFIDIRPYMNRTPFTVRKDCSASRAHQAYISLGLRHLLVVDARNRVAGVITRKDLDHAAGHGWWRVSAPAPKPTNSFFTQLLSGAVFRRARSGGNLAGAASGGGPLSPGGGDGASPQGGHVAHASSDSALLRGHTDSASHHGGGHH